jgi:hypothetical protein
MGTDQISEAILSDGTHDALLPNDRRLRISGGSDRSHPLLYAFISF